ncbi:MAG: hypothetical protein INF75_05875 [Roseomonas sp.]|nr:hypothetical protein [Roseomonas sp.]MCA3332796.1 hypothetical protein [Roseomonas sp.]MCA3336787.1 hypothetical protein [Roseomonas sp.]MCA3354777.1 hypothetical protein [Roseomonas sp.]MCA3362664.1 hypothetical protein [Roseomonas sp.]
MQNARRIALIALCLTFQGSFSSMFAQSWHSEIGTRSVSSAFSSIADPLMSAKSFHLTQDNSGQPPEGQAEACFSFFLSRLRLFEVVGSVCRVPLPERLAGFVSRGVSLGEGRFEALYGVDARSRLRRQMDESLARLGAEELGVACADASQKLVETDKHLFDTVEGQSAVEDLFRKLSAMTGRPTPNGFDCQ